MPVESIRVSNLQSVQRAINRMERTTVRFLMAVVGASGWEVARKAKEEHQKRPGGGGHPGDRYYEVTGLLTKSIRALAPKRRGDLIVEEITAGQEYAPYVEYGTSKHPAYPFMRPALDDATPIIVPHIRRALSNAADAGWR